ncbi:MAG: hypothetical protein V2A71_06455 [Candidatus Eisenbacteria bacterium]
MFLKSKQAESLHRERMFLAEKGMEIPTELYAAMRKAEKKPGEPFRGTRAALLVLGAMLICIGVVLTSL